MREAIDNWTGRLEEMSIELDIYWNGTSKHSVNEALNKTGPKTPDPHPSGIFGDFGGC